jgi:hypothetical protein
MTKIVKNASIMRFHDELCQVDNALTKETMIPADMNLTF